MKRIWGLLVLAALLAPTPAPAEEALPRQLILSPGESREFALPFAGYWDSDAPEVAMGEGSRITAYEEGQAIVALVSPQGEEWLVEVAVTAGEDDVPPLIRGAIDLALSEWEENLGKTFTQKNKYTAWYCGTGPKCQFGWCGGFVSYCLDTAGVPMDDYNESTPQEGGVPYAVRAAGVGKLYTGYEKMDRLTNIPRPGYLVIYGKRDYYAYIHIGMVTDVVDRGNGVYQIYTVEGNVSSRIKRYCYLYDTNARADKNMSSLPEAEWTQQDIYQYTPHQKEWYVNIFCQTWY